MASPDGNASGPGIRLEHRDGYGIADLHMHTDHSDGMAPVSAVMEYVEHRTNLDVIAITDHDTLDGSLAARELAARRNYSFELVMGNEITTLSGHLLALFIEKPVNSPPAADSHYRRRSRPGRALHRPPSHELADAKRRPPRPRQGDVQRRRRPASTALRPTIPRWRVGSFPARCEASTRANTILPKPVGSDAHFLPAVGSGYTIFPGNGAEDLLRALQGKTTVAGGFREPSLREIGLGRILAQQVRSLLVLPIRRVGQKASRKMRIRGQAEPLN